MWTLPSFLDVSLEEIGTSFKRVSNSGDFSQSSSLQKHSLHVSPSRKLWAKLSKVLKQLSFIPHSFWVFHQEKIIIKHLGVPSAMWAKMKPEGYKSVSLLSMCTGRSWEGPLILNTHEELRNYVQCVFLWGAPKITYMVEPSFRSPESGL